MKGNSFRFSAGFIYGILIFIGPRSADGSYFFHEPSYIELAPPDTSTDFGFSIDYQQKFNSFVIGSPLADLNGGVYKCSLDPIAKSETPTCSKININVDQLAGDYNRSQSEKQNFCLGASLSVTPEYLFTCAPLWTSYIFDQKTFTFGSLGTCFLHNGTQSYRYNGLLEQWVKKPNGNEFDHIFGGIGWKTFYDPTNNLMLISNSLFKHSISVLHMEKPFDRVSLVIFSESYKLVGTDFAVGNFFDKRILYAFSGVGNADETGVVAFLYADENKSLNVLWAEDKIVTISDPTPYTMYGASIHSVYLDGDMVSELIVGAPAYAHDKRKYESGAVYFYRGGGKVETKTRSNLCIYGKKDGSRFGSAISSLDIDGDKFPEIFVSAPYEDEYKGAVYILSGYEVTTFFQNASKLLALSDLTHTQRIVTSHKLFGYSLHAIKDFDDYGGNMLAVGAPQSSKAVLYRSVPVVDVSIATGLYGKEWVQQQDSTFVVRVTVDVKFIEKQNVSNAKLVLKTYIIGDPAHIKNSTYDINLTNTETKYFVDVEVFLDDENISGDYQFKATVQSDEERLKNTRYDRSLVTIKDYSKTKSNLYVERRCKNDDMCLPSLFINKFTWTGGQDNTYILGSSMYENISLVVINKGSPSSVSCMLVKITGAKIVQIECIHLNQSEYKCDLLKMNYDEERNINIALDMRQVSNMEEKIEVNTKLINNCAAYNVSDSKNDINFIHYKLNTSDISVDGLNFERNVTDSESSSPIISIQERFTITNNGSVSWKSLYLLITFKKLSFVQNYLVYFSPCTKTEFDDLVQFNCTVDLKARSNLKIWTTTNVIKKDILKNFIDGKVQVTSTYTLLLLPTSEIRNKSLTSTLYYQTDEHFANNKLLIILVAVILGCIVIGIISGILYKIGFFKRKQKKKLDDLRRQSTVRREQRPDDSAKCSEENSEDEIEIIEDIALQLRSPHDTNDSSNLI